MFGVRPTLRQQIHMIFYCFFKKHFFLLLWLLSHFHPGPQFQKIDDKELGLSRFPTVFVTQSHYVQKQIVLDKFLMSSQIHLTAGKESV